MRICLINPPRIQPKLWGKPAAFQPLDIAYVAAVLEKEGHNVSIIDCPTEGWKNLIEIDGIKFRLGLTIKEIKERIEKLNPELVIISVPFSGWWQTAFETASVIKNFENQIKIALIGLHPSAKPVETLSEPSIDFVIIGEPEITACELVQALEKKNHEYLRSIRGLGFRINDEVIMNPPRPIIEDLDSLPFPARHLLPMRQLFEAVKQIPIRGELNKPCARVLTSRGCPNKCIFCSNHIVMGRKWRARSPENVVDELEELVKEYGVKQIDFEDDNLTFDKQRMAAICDLIVERQLRIEWFTPNGVRADRLDEELLAKMKKAGCHRIYIAPESGVQHVVNKIIKKNLNLKKVEDAVISSIKVGIKVSCFFIIGFIGETKEDIQATINFAYKLRGLGADRFYFSYATPLVGTELYRQAKETGYLCSEFSDEALARAQPLIETPQFSRQELQHLCERAVLVNPVLNRDRLIRAMHNPMKALNILLSRSKKKLKTK